MFAGFETVEAIDTTGVVDGGFFAGYLYGLGFTTAFAETAMDAFVIGNDGLQPRKACQHTKYRTYRTDAVAIQTSPTGCHKGYEKPCDEGRDKDKAGLKPYLNIVEGIAVHLFCYVCQRIISYQVEGLQYRQYHADIAGVGGYERCHAYYTAHHQNDEQCKERASNDIMNEGMLYVMVLRTAFLEEFSP